MIWRLFVFGSVRVSWGSHLTRTEPCFFIDLASHLFSFVWFVSFVLFFSASRLLPQPQGTALILSRTKTRRSLPGMLFYPQIIYTSDIVCLWIPICSFWPLCRIFLLCLICHICRVCLIFCLCCYSAQLIPFRKQNSFSTMVSVTA